MTCFYYYGVLVRRIQTDTDVRNHVYFLSLSAMRCIFVKFFCTSHVKKANCVNNTWEPNVTWGPNQPAAPMKMNPFDPFLCSYVRNRKESKKSIEIIVSVYGMRNGKFRAKDCFLLFEFIFSPFLSLSLFNTFETDQCER